MDNESIYLPDNFTTFLSLSQQERDLLVKEEINKLSVVYIHTSPSGKSYIGQTCILGNTRWHQHRRAARKGVKTKFATALREHSQLSDWEHGILWVSDDRGEINEMEMHLIEKFNTVSDGYNIKTGNKTSPKCKTDRKLTFDIYHKDGRLLAGAVSLSDWCRQNPAYNISALSTTLSADWRRPHSARNKHFHKDIYAVYHSDNRDLTTRNQDRNPYSPQTGHNSQYTKPVDIYHKDGTLIAENVSIQEWCREHPTYKPSSFYPTIKSDPSKPWGPKNTPFYKNLYAVYHGMTRQESYNVAINATLSYRVKLVNIYDKSGTIIAKSISIQDWCKANPKYSDGGLYRTAKADLSKPHTNENPHYSQGIRAEYI